MCFAFVISSISNRFVKAITHYMQTVHIMRFAVVRSLLNVKANTLHWNLIITLILGSIVISVLNAKANTLHWNLIITLILGSIVISVL